MFIGRDSKKILFLAPLGAKHWVYVRLFRSSGGGSFFGHLFYKHLAALRRGQTFCLEL
jgi:hypothetical protein